MTKKPAIEKPLGDEDWGPMPPVGLQYTIGSLMIVIAAIALVLASPRGLGILVVLGTFLIFAITILDQVQGT